MNKKVMYFSLFVLVILLVIYGFTIYNGLNTKKYTSITILNKEVSLAVGDSYIFSTEQNYENVLWETSDDSIATIDKISGELVVKDNGTVVIKASLLEDLNIYDSFLLNVSNSSKYVINESNVSLLIKDNYQLVVTSKKGEEVNNVEWNSLDSNIADIDDNGLITAKKVGNTTITATIGDDVLVCDVVILDKIINIESVSLDESELTLQIGEKKKININVYPIDATISTIKYSSDNLNVVAVDKKGNLLLVGPGTATITVTINDSYSINCIVTVIEKEYSSNSNSNNSSSNDSNNNNSTNNNVTPSNPPVSNNGVVDIIDVDDQPVNNGISVNAFDMITVKYKVLQSPVTELKAEATSASGLPVTFKYYSDSSCKKMIMSTIPVTNCVSDTCNQNQTFDVGDYYVIASTKGNATYPPIQSKCTKAITIKKTEDKITVNYKSVNYPTTEIKADVKSKSGLPVSVKYYSDSSCKNSVLNIIPVTNCVSNSCNQNQSIDLGTYYIKAETTGNDIYEKTSLSCTKAVSVVSVSEKIEFVKYSAYVRKGETYKIELKNDVSDSITWASSNVKVATVNNKGIVTGKAVGNSNITATLSNGKTASISIAVLDSNSELISSYESKTLGYYIEKEPKYLVTHIYVEDAYNQMKVALSPAESTEYTAPRQLAHPDDLMTREVTEKGYQNKALVAVNASPMVKQKVVPGFNDNTFGENAPSHWFGTAAIPYVINNGQVIRNSVNETLQVGKYNVIYGLSKDGYLKNYSYPVTKGVINNPDKLITNITNDGVKYTFGFSPVIISNSKESIDRNKSDNNEKNIRQSICQINKKNFIIITSTTGYNDRGNGISFVDLLDIGISMGCKYMYNLDGGGSASYVYKGNSNNIIKYPTAYNNRGLADMLYFVEK